MSEILSWFKIGGGFVFLTDDDIKAWHEKHERAIINWYDFVGHQGLAKVFNLDNSKYYHHEGFINMPDVGRKEILNGKCDNMFARAGNLSEATPEFIPMMKRLATRFQWVRECLDRNPYKNYNGGNLTYLDKMKAALDAKMSGSTIQELLKGVWCDETMMKMVLERGKWYLNRHQDGRHYQSIINNPAVTRDVLLMVRAQALNRDVIMSADNAIMFGAFSSKKKAPRKRKDIRKIKTKIVRKQGAKIRMSV